MPRGKNGFEMGNKLAGSRKGIPNELTAEAKDAIHHATNEGLRLGLNSVDWAEEPIDKLFKLFGARYRTGQPQRGRSTCPLTPARLWIGGAVVEKALDTFHKRVY
jgi:hypothetical protein